MAVVGEAHIVVKAITAGIGDEIERALKATQAGIKKEGYRLGESLSDGFRKGTSGQKNPFAKLFDRDAAEKARQAFARLQKAGMAVQSGLGILSGSIGALVAALGALIGSAGGAAASLVAVGGAAIGAGIGMKLAGMALGGVTGPMKQVGKAAGGTKKTIAELREEMQQLRFDAEEAALSEKEAALNLEKARENLARVQDLPPNSMARREAELSYQQADLALRRAIDRNNDLQEEIKNGPKQDSGAGADPYAGLTESQKKFAKILVSLKPKFDQLKEAVASGFLPILGSQIETLFGKNFPTLMRMFTGIGQALGDATDSVFNFINSSKGMAQFETLFKNSEGVIRDMGDTLAAVMESVLTLLEAAAPITEEFTGWLKESAQNFRDFVGVAATDGSLKKFFEDSARVAKDFGAIFGNIFKGLGGLIADSLKPGSGGDMLMQWLKGATEGFANMGKDGNFAAFMQGAADNAIKMFQSLGAIFGVIGDMAADPTIGEFWDAIALAEEPLRGLLENGAAAGPAIGELLVAITRIMEAFGDQGQLKAFFGTLRDIAVAIADFFDIPAVKAFLGFLGPIIGYMLAFGTALKLGSFYFKALLGTFNLFASPFRYFFTKDVTTGMTGFGTLTAKIKSGFETMALKAMYFKDWAVQALADAKIGLKLYADKAKEVATSVGTKLKTAFTNAGTAAKTLATNIGAATKALFLQGIEVAKNIGKWIAQKAALIGAAIAQTAMKVATIASNIATSIATGIQAAFNAVMALNPIYLIVAGVLALIAALVWFFTQTELGKEIWGGFMSWLQGLWDNFVSALEAIGRFIGEFFQDPVGTLQRLWVNVMNFLIDRAEGFINFFIDGINNLFGGLRDFGNLLTETLGIGAVFSPIGHVRLPRVPALAEGGVVSPSAGGSLVQVAEAGRPERVEPLDENGLSKRDKELMKAMSSGNTSGINITVNPSAGMDEAELAEMVSRRLAFQMRAGGAY